MSVDRSLRSHSLLTRHRNVLTRAERVALLQDRGRWDDSTRAIGLPKVAHRKAKAGKKKAKETAASTEEAKQ